jgi:hypothetical protein
LSSSPSGILPWAWHWICHASMSLFHDSLCHSLLDMVSSHLWGPEGTEF